MPTLLEMVGAPRPPTEKATSVYIRRFFSGWVTNRSPFEQQQSRGESRFYGGATDVLWSGSNIELTNSGLLQRRPGFSSWTTGTVADTLIGAASFKNLAGNVTVLADGGAAVYTATSTAFTTLKTKATGSGQTQFLTVGSLLFGCDGATGNWYYNGTTVFNDGIVAPATTPTLSFETAGAAWTASTVTSAYSYIVDTNGNVQVATTAGTTGTTQPTWATALNATTTDNTVTWTNYGSTGNTWQAGKAYPLNYLIVDPNQNWQRCISAGTSGSSAPSWSLGTGQDTVDGWTNLVWQNEGPATPAGIFETVGAQYAYAYVSSAVGHYSTCSPLSANTGILNNQKVTVGGDYSTDPQVDKIAIFRTPDGGATLLQVAEISNNTAGGTWFYADTAPDSSLNVDIVGPQADANNPAPLLQCQAFYAGRRWGGSGNYVYYSGGPDTTTGNGSMAWPPLNFFEFPQKIIRLVAQSSGVFVFTTDAIYVIVGNNPLNFFVAQFSTNGISNPSALTIDSGNLVFFSTDRRLLVIQSSNVADMGVAIADQLALLNPTKVSVTAHVAGTNDKAIYLCDGSSTIYRLNPSQLPEGTLAWSTPYTPSPAPSFVSSVETAAGVRQLLVGSTNTLLYRNVSTYTDAGGNYTANFVMGSLVLASPGNLSDVSSLIVESAAVGTIPTVGILLDNISGTFTTLATGVADPPELSASSSLNSERYYLSQSSIPTLCRHMQVQISFIAENFAGAVYSISVTADNVAS
jgi:hypothetical protein